MEKKIIIHSTLNEVRIAITEDGKLAELFIELPNKEKNIGNIYLGKVNRVIQGINAAFVNIGLNQDAFLHFSDIDESIDNISTDEEEDEAVETAVVESKTKNNRRKTADRKNTDKAANEKKISFSTKKGGSMQINLEPKQDIIVQIVREAYSSKGVKVTSKIGIPGRYVVLMPLESVIGISRKIVKVQERRRLRQLAKSSLPVGCGIIIRTAAQNISETELLNDWNSLVKIWKEIEQKVKKAKEPMLLYEDLPIATSVIRDLFTKEVTKVVIDSKKLYKDIMGYLKWASPDLMEKIEQYNDQMPIFEKFGIEKELAQTYKRKVKLHSGGSIVIDQAEAMFVIDVNAGRSIRNDKQEKIVYKTNLEAAREIARQIRLRDIAGIIIIDFIDMESDVHRKKIYSLVRNELKRDRAKTVVFPLTKLNLMQITRQRINQNITEKLSETCPMCQGTGRVTSKAVIINSIERWLKNFRANSKEFRLILMIHPNIAAFMSEGTISRLSRMMIKYFVKIKVQQSNLLRVDEFKFYSQRQEKDITLDFI